MPCAFWDAAKATLPAAEFSQCGIQIGGVKVWPLPSGKKKFGIGGFPQQKVRKTLLSSGANQEIHLTAVCGQRLTKHASQHFSRGLTIMRKRAGHACGGARDGITRRVIYGNPQMKAATFGGCE